MQLNPQHACLICRWGVRTSLEVLMCGNMPWLVTSVPALTGQHQVLPLFGSSSSMPAPSAECPFSYLPVVSGRAPFSSSTSAVGHQAMLAAASKEASSMALAEVSRADSCRLPVLSTSLGHACFEVWIAMELCDGGTLAEQLQRGFHCHAGSEEIDMVSSCRLDRLKLCAGPGSHDSWVGSSKVGA
jgi:hypothetical protein